MRILCRFVAPALLAWLVGCQDSAPTRPSQPTQPGVAGDLSRVISGVVSQTVAGVSRPLASKTVLVYVWLPNGGSWLPQPPTTDQDGRYSASVPKGSRVFLNAWHPPDQQQPCLASAAVNTDTTVDVRVVATGTVATLPPAASPMVTGFVYETTPQGRTPLRGVYVTLDALPFFEVPVATTQTDDAGRFVLCRVDAPVGLIVGGIGYQPWFRLIPGTSDLHVEIELERVK